MKNFKRGIEIAEQTVTHETRRDCWDGNNPQIPILTALLKHYEAKMLCRSRVKIGIWPPQ